MAKQNVIPKQKEPQPAIPQNFTPVNVELEVITPIIAPFLPPNKEMKKIIIQDIMKCYDKEIYELLEHLDRAFDRDSSCNALISSAVVSATLRPQYPDIVARGLILFPKNSIRVTVRKVGSASTTYEYIVAGTKINTTLSFNMDVKFPVIIPVGGRISKGYGLVKISKIG